MIASERTRERTGKDRERERTEQKRAPTECILEGGNKTHFGTTMQARSECVSRMYGD